MLVLTSKLIVEGIISIFYNNFYTTEPALLFSMLHYTINVNLNIYIKNNNFIIRQKLWKYIYIN